MSTDFQRFQQIAPPEHLLGTGEKDKGEKGETRAIRSWMWRLSAAFGCALIVLASFVAGRLTMRQKPVDPRSLLRLSARATGSGAELTWAADNPDVQNAVRGSLVILDSADGDRVELSPVQLKAGKYDYAPLHADLTFLLTVYRNDNSFIGETKNIHLDHFSAPSLGKVPASGPPPVRSAQRRQPDAADTRASTTSSQNSAAPASPHPVFPPTLRIEIPPESEAATGLPQPGTPVSSVTPGAPFNPSGPPVTPPDPVPPPDRPDSASPLPLRQISPHISPDDRSLIHGNVSVRVTVSVDPHGSVTDARPLDIQSPEEKLLAPYAVQAAKLWRFDPARRGGTPVASETVIVFHFGGR